MSSSGPAAAATEPPGASQRSAPSGSCPHPKQRLYLSSISGQLRASGSGHPAACPDARVTVTPAERWAGEGGRQNRGGRHDGRAGGEGENAGAGLHPPVPPVVTHAAHRHDGSPVPGGPRPRASSRPHHSIPGGWANTGCKTHTAGTGGSAPGTHGCQQPPLADASRGGGGQHPAPSPIWGTHRRGVSSSALALHACKGDAVPAPAPAQNRWQRYPPPPTKPASPRTGTRGSGCREPARPKQGAGGCSGAHRPSKTPLTSLPGGSRSWPQGPRVSPGSAPSRAPTALVLEVAPHQLQGFGKGWRCLWAMGSRGLRVPS